MVNIGDQELADVQDAVDETAMRMKWVEDRMPSLADAVDRLQKERGELAWALALYFGGTNPFSLPDEERERFGKAMEIARRLTGSPT